MKEHQFSFIIPVYNEEKYIVEALESILAFTGKDFEIIVVDDNSTDSTFQIVNDLKEKTLV